MDDEIGHCAGRRCPEPAFGPGLLPTSLVGVFHGSIADFVTSLVMRDDQRGTGLLLQDHDRAQRDRNVKGRLDQLLDRAFTQVKPTTEVTHHRRQTRANDVRADLGGDRGTIEQTALRTGASVGLVLGDDCGQHGKLGDLMPGRFRIVGARFVSPNISYNL